MTSIPSHIAIIMDGNGRWAQKRSMPRSSGHQSGVKATRNVVEHCARLGVKALTVYAFSSENWGRPQAEVSFLMELFVRALRNEVEKLHESGIQLRFIGEITEFPEGLQREIAFSSEKTASNKGMQLNIAVNYGGRHEMVRVMRRIASDVKTGLLSPDDIDENLITRYSWLPDGLEPDLFIRTGGEQRLSNYLLWHLAYTELYFTQTLWPDFGAEELDAAIQQYSHRQRRFGQTGEQVQSNANSRNRD